MKFILDTNICRDMDLLRGLSEHASKNGHRVLISVLVVAERAAQLRRLNPESYREIRIRQSLNQFRFEVEELSHDDSYQLALKLSSWHPDEGAWRQAKLIQHCQALLQSAPPDAEKIRCPATVDWYLAAHAALLGAEAQEEVAYGHLPSSLPEAVWVTEDRGREFNHVWRVGRQKALELAKRPTDKVEP